ncbi:MAG TPA: VanW family protein [Candidatus Methanoperedens sp.]|nr:VanW family protein [Candidatus Methanoperedens sp.]
MKNKVLIVISLSFLLIAGILAPLAFGFGKTGKETTVLGRDYSLLSKTEIETKLQGEFPMEGRLKLIEGDRIFSVELASISATIDFEKTASNLLFRRLKQGFGKYIKDFFENKDFELTIKYDDEKVNQIVAEISSQIDKPFIPAEIILNGKMSVKDGQIGRIVDQIKLKDLIIEKIKKYEINTGSTIFVENVGRLPVEEEEVRAMERAKKLIGKSVTFQDTEVEITVDDKTLVSWVDFESGCQKLKIDDYVTSISQSLKKDPQDASFKFENGKVLEFLPDRPGYYLDEEKMKINIIRDFAIWENSNEKSNLVELPLIKSEAKIKNSEVNNLGIKELLGKGTSSFRHSSIIRNFNVEKGASIVNRVLVAPNETFSFIKSLGEVSLESGYKKAYVIRQGKTELDVGGGICQVSTTLFRAMLDAGLDITSRQAHAYRVSYYEEDTKPGFDATVFIPKPDLTFVNDTEHYVLIQSYYDGVNKKLTYEIYGTSDGRKAEIGNYKQWGAAPPPPDVWIDDPTLPAGKVVQDEQRIPGLKTAFDWTVTRNGEVINQKTFTSSYVPWAAVYRRGTGN